MSTLNQFIASGEMALVLFFVGLAIVCIIIITSAYIYAYYSKMLKQLPNAVKFKNLETMISNLESKKEDLIKEVDKHKTEVENSKRVIEEANKLKKWLEDNGVTIAQLESEISNKRQDYEKASKILQEETNKLLEKRKELQDAEQALANKKSEAISSLNDIKLQARDAERQRDQASNEFDKISDKADKLRAENNQLNIESLSAKVKLENLLSEIKKLEEKISKLEKEIEKKYEELGNTINNLKTQKTELESQNKELDGIIRGNKAAVEMLNSQHKALQETLENLTGQITRLEPPELKTRLEDLYRAQIIGEFKYRDTILNENQWLDKFKDDMKSDGVIFPKRALYAFHTALKIADISPLVVLAGISGTGKSLLPQLYANAIGMHFLPIAVQPRWDGPQDLFGFYNYMENRFKATELSRLLWQLDAYNNKGNFGNLKSSMALVLLDEMNLAKVEYYFSELLSKLEYRNNIHDAKSRSPVEIEIESGSLRRHEKNERIFVGNNILFVGTMNEDETTQNLSDKVIDRSNVLRFGKPNKTDTIPDKEKLMKKTKTEYLLNYEHWQHWKNRDLDLEKKNILNKYLDDLNKEMNEIGKPFGYRVSQAVMKYVSTYPMAVSDTRAFNDAIADQIEMKILPKLNGIELEKGNKLFKAITEIAGKLGDTILLDTLRTAIEDNTKPFFEWRGVTRIDN
ncbi:MAG TPA: hypothetical protein DD381_05010 [Lentisphaeria bacterium]|nr:MAG: hypothetical protein A2X47_07660 [Lentisphaerae bacterium GWF2_38_69]HBM15690.1 hypothetical protein [Lentisphaeria bacterium]